MAWPTPARFDRDDVECPECGADNTANGERRCLTNIRFVVDGGLKVVFEARCPCGWEDSLSLATVPDDAHPNSVFDTEENADLGDYDNADS